LVKPVAAFYTLRSSVNGKLYRQSYCKACGNKKRLEYGKSKPGSHCYRRYHMKQYGLTVAQYDAILEAQGHVCAICRHPETHVSSFTKKTRRLCVDHDHNTGRVRGLLCSRCNRAIGMLGDDLPRLRAVVAYLEAATRGT
jgi:hypothetical protein